MTKEYIAVEPIVVKTVYEDTNGKLHLNREDAIVANFTMDLESLVEKVLYEEGGTYKVGELILPVLRVIAQRHPDYLRILVGDRSAT